MNPLFKHLTARLWLTAILGGVTCFAVLPWWQQLFGINWLLLPAMVIMVISFGITGWGLNRMGVAFVGRCVNEASVWERAGMMAEAEGALQSATALFDSFWLSPVLRRKRTPWMTAILARFYLGQTARNPHARAMVAGYLCQHPEDDRVAEGWLEQLLNRDHHTRVEYEAAECIGETLDSHRRIQQLLMQFHLGNRRSDFDAMRVYQQVWQQQHPLPPDLTKELTRLLIHEGVLTHWALQVYLSAWHAGEKSALKGIAAAVCWLRLTVENRQDLAAAKKVVAAMPKDRIKQLAERFKPTEDTEVGQTPAKRKMHPGAERSKALAKEMVTSSRSWIQTITAHGAAVGRRIWAYAFAHPAVVGGGVAVMVTVLFALGWQLRGKSVVPPAPMPIEEVQPVLQPFTIQVAAYMHAEDAQGFVDRLKKEGLDVFWTKATSADRTWFQVKVGHFETKQQARLFGQDLKTKGLIDDFYVANYQEPQQPKPK